MSISSLQMVVISIFLWAIFSWTVSVCKGSSSYDFDAINIQITPIPCRSAIFLGTFESLKYRSRIETAKNKVWSLQPKLVMTSIIQSIILALRAGVIWCIFNEFSVFKRGSISFCLNCYNTTYDCWVLSNKDSRC